MIDQPSIVYKTVIEYLYFLFFYDIFVSTWMPVMLDFIFSKLQWWKQTVCWFSVFCFVWLYVVCHVCWVL